MVFLSRGKHCIRKPVFVANDQPVEYVDHVHLGRGISSDDDAHAIDNVG